MKKPMKFIVRVQALERIVYCQDRSMEEFQVRLDPDAVNFDPDGEASHRANLVIDGRTIPDGVEIGKIYVLTLEEA